MAPAQPTPRQVQRRSPDLSALRLLVAIGRQGSLARGAAEEGLSQPAASKKIAQLERLLGLRLIIRSSRGSTFTPEGAAVAGRSREILELIEQLVGVAARMRGASSSSLRIAASMTIAEYLMPFWLNELRSRYPDLHAGLRMANSQDVQAMVRSGEADVGFIESPEVDARLRSLRIGRDRLVVVVPPEHAWAQFGGPIRVDDLRERPLIAREEGSGTRETLARVLGPDTVRPSLELGSISAVKGAVVASGGAAALSVLAVSAELESGELVEVRVEGADLGRDLLAVWSTTQGLSAWSRDLVHLARSHAPQWSEQV